MEKNENIEFDEKTEDFYITKTDFIFDFIDDSKEYLDFLYDKLSELDSGMYI